jgi:NAD(P)-dependent dehydrogenase (short-subunit alcohol dehydrogenase family)
VKKPNQHAVAVVTGASSGIGSAIVTRLLDDGWSVVGLSRSRVDGRPDRFRSLQVDVSDFAQLRSALDSIPEVQAIVHAAGMMHTARVGALDPSHGAAMWAVHVGAAEVLVDALANRISAGGRIVLIGSRAAAGVAGRSQYAATKAALLGMARSWAAELVSRQITVNIVAPAATATPMLVDPNRVGTPPKMPPIGRLIAPEEVAGLTAFLLGPHAGAIT